MRFFSTFTLAFRALRRNPTRSLLTTLGIVIGIAAVIAMTEIGKGSSNSIARALINNPPVLFADEPTGNLDSQTSIEVMNMFTELNRQEKITIILVTHSQEIADCAKRVIRLADGMIKS